MYIRGPARHHAIEGNGGLLVPTWTFGPYQLLPAQQILREGDQPVRLGGRAFDILVALVERAGELVERDELMARVWPNLHVDDSTLRVHLAALRKVLGHGQGASRYIVNVAGRGYRFVAPVERQDSGASEGEEGPRAAAAPGTTQQASSFTLPPWLSRMVGRGELVAELADRMRQRNFLTIVGPGGMGKTTVALALAEQIGPAYRDGARFVDLAAIADPSLVAGAAAASLDLQLFSGDPLAELLVHLRERQVLLVLDSCEHLIDAVAVLAEAVRGNASGVDILATSREPLRAAGEFICRLAPLGVPEVSDGLSAADALAFPAVHLFVERAIASLETFVLTNPDVPVVVEICRRLDGIPLAIELAAARVDFFGLRGLAQRLDDAFMVLTAGRRTARARHQTLRAMLDWSYDTLPQVEQTVLGRLAVFRGGFSLESAVAVAAGDVPPVSAPVGDLPRAFTPFANTPPGDTPFRDTPVGDTPFGEVQSVVISAAQAINGLADLAAKSLVTVDVSGAAVQYRLLSLTRTYAAEKLAASGETAAVARRHAVQFCKLVAGAEGDWAVQTWEAWLATYGRLIDDLRAAVDWAFSAGGDAAIGVALTAASAPIWFALSLVAEFRERAEQALDLLGGSGQPDQEREMQLNVALGAAIYNTLGPTDRMVEASHRALAMARARGATVVELQALWALGRARYVCGDYRGALVFCNEFSAIADISGLTAACLVRDLSWRSACISTASRRRHDPTRSGRCTIPPRLSAARIRAFTNTTMAWRRVRRWPGSSGCRALPTRPPRLRPRVSPMRAH